MPAHSTWRTSVDATQLGDRTAAELRGVARRRAGRHDRGRCLRRCTPAFRKWNPQGALDCRRSCCTCRRFRRGRPFLVRWLVRQFWMCATWGLSRPIWLRPEPKTRSVHIASIYCRLPTAATGSLQPYRIAIKRSPKQRRAPTIIAAADETFSICPITTTAAPARAATA